MIGGLTRSGEGQELIQTMRANVGAAVAAGAAVVDSTLVVAAVAAVPRHRGSR